MGSQLFSQISAGDAGISLYFRSAAYEPVSLHYKSILVQQQTTEYKAVLEQNVSSSHPKSLCENYSPVIGIRLAPLCWLRRDPTCYDADCQMHTLVRAVLRLRFERCCYDRSG
jgi:hypothetical protein